jgi:hypothetical protein
VGADDSTNNVFSYEASGSDTHSQVASTVDVSFLNQQVSVVVCITPALPKKGVTGNAGDWVKQNQYNGSKCNTAGSTALTAYLRRSRRIRCPLSDSHAALVRDGL